MARSIFLSAAPPRLVIDPLDSTVANVGERFRDPNRIPDAETARFVPRDPFDRDAYEALYRRLFGMFPRYVWCDEAAMVFPAQGAQARAPRIFLIQGAKRELGHIACHTRPREVDRNLIAQSQHTLIFGLPNPDDLAVVAAQTVGNVGALADALRQLEPRGFAWWNDLAKTLTLCPALKL